jgi:hypothetical protein
VPLETISQQSKECNRCHRVLPLSQFDRDKAFGSGHRPVCKDCKKKRINALLDRWAHDRAKGTDLLTEKECKDCHTVKPISAFGLDKHHKSGTSHICKECKNDRQQLLREKWKHERTSTGNAPQEKTCRTCGKRYPAAHFTCIGNSKDGLSSTCKSCQVLWRKQKKLQWREERRTQEPVSHKRCPSCHRDLPVSHYYVMEGWKDGVSFYCKECTLQKHKTTGKRWADERILGKRTVREKECIHCHKILPVSRFYKNLNWKDGFNSVCIQCERIQSQEYMARWKEEQRATGEVLTEKKCSYCNRVLPIEMFNANKRRRDGLTSECKACASQRQYTYITRWAEERKHQKEDAFSLFPSFEKKCQTCGKVLPHSSFYLKKRSKDGLSSSCIECTLKICKQSRIKRKATLISIIPAEKICKKCQRVLPYTAFTRNNIKKDGLNPLCKECKNKAYKEYLRRPEVHERMKAWERAYSKQLRVRAKGRIWARKYSKRPYVQKKRVAYMKEYMARPEVIRRRKQYMREYNKRKKQQKEMIS